MQHIWQTIALVSVVTCSPMFAQSGSDRISRPAPGSPSARGAQPAGAAEVTFTNNVGKVYTMAELTDRLQELRTAVDEALPLLSAFNENYSNTIAGQGGLAGAISGILSGARRGSGAQDQGGSPGRGSSALTNIVAVLNGLFGTNTAPGAVGAVNTNMVHDLLALEGELQPVASVLRNMNLESARGSSSRADEYEPELESGDYEPPPSPTGRR